MKIHIVPILKDNYAYLLEANDRSAAIIDPGEAAPVIAALEALGLNLALIINTHHHGDHIAGNDELKSRYGAKLAAPANETHRIAGIDTGLAEGTPFDFAGVSAEILETPGHTAGGICLYFPLAKAVFTGDTLFSGSCGRLFEGTAAQMWDSFQKLIALPDDTRMYPGHEYTLANCKFGMGIEPENADLKTRYEEVKELRRKNLPSIPSTMGLEKKTNVFLRAGSAERFGEIRKLRDAA